MLALVVDFSAHHRVAHSRAKCYHVSIPPPHTSLEQWPSALARLGEISSPERGILSLKTVIACLSDSSRKRPGRVSVSLAYARQARLGESIRNPPHLKPQEVHIFSFSSLHIQVLPVWYSPPLCVLVCFLVCIRVSYNLVHTSLLYRHSHHSYSQLMSSPVNYFEQLMTKWECLFFIFIFVK